MLLPIHVPQFADAHVDLDAEAGAEPPVRYYQSDSPYAVAVPSFAAVAVPPPSAAAPTDDLLPALLAAVDSNEWITALAMVRSLGQRPCGSGAAAAVVAVSGLCHWAAVST